MKLNDKVWGRSRSRSPLLGHGMVTSLGSDTWVWYGHGLISGTAQELCVTGMGVTGIDAGETFGTAGMVGTAVV